MAKGRLSAEQQAEIEERRAAVAEEKAREEAARKAAWEEVERSRKETEALRKAQEPSKEFVEAAKASKERLARERIDLYRKSYDLEAKRRNADEGLEERFRKRHPEMLEKHLSQWADFQEAAASSDANLILEATRAMAHAWREKEELLIGLAVERKKKGGEKAKGKARRELAAESAKEKLALLDEQRARAVKPARRKKKAKKG